MNSHTTLVDGSVGVNTDVGAEVRLTPGEQAVYNNASNNLNKRMVDTRVYTAWREGKFMLDNESLESIMKKMERWYNVETVFINEGTGDSRFSGTMDRYDHVTDVLDKIALTTDIKFGIEGNTVYITRAK